MRFFFFFCFDDFTPLHTHLLISKKPPFLLFWFSTYHTTDQPRLRRSGRLVDCALWARGRRHLHQGGRCGRRSGRQGRTRYNINHRCCCCFSCVSSLFIVVQAFRKTIRAIPPSLLTMSAITLVTWPVKNCAAGVVDFNHLFLALLSQAWVPICLARLPRRRALRW